MDDYLWMKALHIVAIIAWMAGLFYLPRIFVYHTRFAPGTETAEIFAVMEVKLLRIIMNPAMIVSILSGFYLVYVLDAWRDGWMHAKFTAVFAMLIFHMMLGRWRRQLAAGENRHSERFYRLINEVPTVLLIAIVILVVVKPF